MTDTGKTLAPVALTIDQLVAQHEVRLNDMESENKERREDFRDLQKDLKNLFYVLICLLAVQVPSIAVLIPETIKKISGH